MICRAACCRGSPVLGREAGLLREFVNGVDVSAGNEVEGSLRVGKFFHLSFSRYAQADGDSLAIAEMIFYNRYLNDDERAQLTRLLADARREGSEEAVAEALISREAKG